MACAHSPLGFLTVDGEEDVGGGTQCCEPGYEGHFSKHPIFWSALGRVTCCSTGLHDVLRHRARCRHLFDELYGVAGIWHDENDWAHIWPGDLSECSLRSPDKQTDAVDGLFRSLEALGQVIHDWVVTNDASMVSVVAKHAPSKSGDIPLRPGHSRARV